MKPVRTSSQTNRLQKFRALGLTLLMSATMIVGLFMALVSPAQARERDNAGKDDVASGAEVKAEQSTESIMLQPDELEPLLLEQGNYLDSDNSDTFFDHSLIERSSESEATTLYVTANGSGTVCTIAQPCKIQTAVDVAENGNEIRVAAGVHVGTGVSTQIVHVDKSVILRGGYTSTNWLVDPDPITNETILDGMNQRAIIYITGTVTSTIEGFTIRNGQRSGYAAGIHQASSTASVLIQNNRFYNNISTGTTGIGGAIYTVGSDQIINNEFFDNFAEAAGGAIALNTTTGSPVIVRYNRIHNNTAGTGVGPVGGGIVVMFGSNATIDGNIIYDNISWYGGGIATRPGSTTLVQNNLIYNNQTRATGGGGGIIVAGVAQLVHNTIVNNSAGSAGGAGIWIHIDGTAGITNTIVASNTATTNPGINNVNGIVFGSTNNIFNNATNVANILVSTITDNPHFADYAGDDFHLTVNSGAVVDDAIATNTTYDVDGQIRPLSLGADIGADEFYDPNITCYARVNDGQIFTDLDDAIATVTQGSDVVKVAGHCQAADSEVVLINQSLILRGGYTTTDWVNPNYGPTIIDAQGVSGRRGIVVTNGSPTIEGLTVTGGNLPSGNGSGVYIAGGTGAVVQNLVLYGNSSSSSNGALGVSGSTNPTIQFNTIVSNTGNGIHFEATGAIHNSILYSNSGAAISGGSGHTYNLINVNPLFMNAAANNYHLTVASPAIGAADPNATLSQDFEGDTRPLGNHFDAGADETDEYPAVTFEPNYLNENDPGTSVTITHTLTNLGTQPDTFVFVANNSLGWAIDFPATSGLLNPGESVQVTIVITVPLSATVQQVGVTTITVTSSLNSGISDTIIDTIAVSQTPGIEFTPTYSLYLLPGEIITYTHILTNTGDYTDTYTLQLESDTFGWAELLPDDPFDVTLASGQAISVVVNIAVPGTAVMGSVNTVIIRATSHYEPSVTKTVTDTVTLASTGPDLVLSKNGPSQILTGDSITYEIGILNQGLLTATNVIITDVLPALLIPPTHTAPYNVTYDPIGHTLVWDVGTLAPGILTTFTVQAQLPATATIGSVITNTIVGTLSETELNTTNNQDSVSTTIMEAFPQLVITPSTLDLSVLAGDSASTVITITNNGTGALEDLTVLPTSYSWLTVQPTMLSSLGVGQSFTFTVQVATTSTLPFGHYLDEIQFAAANHAAVIVDLTVYVHPPLANVTLNANNTANNSIWGAQLLLTKYTPWVRYINGVFAGYESITYQATTDHNGVALLNQVEVGNYAYQASANKHLSDSGSTTITYPSTALSVTLEALPTLVFEPNQANISVQPGTSSHYTFRVRNLGPGHAENFAIETPSDLPWFSSALPSSVTTLEAGESMLVILLLNPGSNETLVTYNRYVTVTADLSAPAYLATSIRITTINTGTLVFTVTNNLGQPLENATVTIIDQSQRTINGPGGANITNDWHTAQADANGQVSFPNLSVSEYTYVIEASGYYNKQGTVDVYPGAPGSSGVNEYEETLDRDPFYYTWSVSETTITDTYAFTVEIVYQSDIAEPALFVSHESICTPANGPGYDSGEWLLVNMGPITLTNITLEPVYPDFSFNVNEGNNVVETLLPGQAITVPFTVYSPTPIGEQPQTGSVNVEAEYLLTNGEVDSVDTYGIIFRCNPGISGEWDWDWDGEVGRVEGHWLGPSRPIFPQSSPHQEDENLEVALLLLLGDATIERQAFIAELSLQGNGEDDIDDIVVYVDIRDENNVFASGFVITPSISTSYGLIPRTDLGPLAADGQLDQQWLIIPGDLGITDTAGAPYIIQAYIVYTMDDQINVITTTPTVVTVYPQPYVRLGYSYSQPDINGDFYVEVTAHNEGYGFARNLTLDLSELFLDEVQYYGDVDNNGRSLIFELTETTINSATQPTEYIFEFGDFAPDETKVGRWYISVDADDGVHLKDPVITRFAVKCTHLPYQGLILSELINCSDFQQEILIEWNEFFCLVERQRILGGPINTANGNYAYIQSHPSLPTVGAPLAFSWTYNSLNSGAYPDLPAFGSPMGVGWSFDYNIRLNFGVTGTVILESPRGTNVQFRETKDGFQAPPLVCGTLESELTGSGDQLYNVTSHNQTTYVFSDTGRLISRTDPQGNEFLFEYDELTGNVSRVSEPVSGQFLVFTYDSNGHLTKVTDTLSRMTQFGYNQLGHLTVVTDTRNQVWTYEYTQLPSGEYVLSHVVDPDGRTVEETQFDSWGRAISQTYGAQSLTIEYDGLRRVVTDGQDNQEVLFYNTQDLLVASRDATGNVERYAFDRFQNRIWRENRNGVPMMFVKTPDGYSTHVSNAQGQSYTFAYDASNNMVYMRDTRQAQTFYEYNEHNKPLTVTNPFGDQVIYTYNEQGQVTTVRDENGNLTRYAYNELGWQTVITDALGNASYTVYDLAGRVISTTDASGMTVLYQYDEADHLIQQTENYLPGQVQNYLNEYNLITRYAYDGPGNQIIMTDTLGFMVRTIYDNEGMVVARVANWQGTITSPAGCVFPPQAPDADICTLYAYDQAGNQITETDPLGRQTRTFYDELNRVIGTIQNWDGVMNSLDNCLFPPAQADQNLCTLYSYDAVGNQILETDPMGRQTRTFYSEVNRVEGVILNWSGTITDLAGCAFPPTQADRDLCTLYTYDELGQVTVVTDPMGRQTRTFYDASNWVTGTVVNWTPSLTSLADCVLSPANQAETNVCTLFGYDKVGNQITVTNALNQTSLTVYDALNRPIITVANWDGMPIDSSDDCIFPASLSDTNVCSITTYDEVGRVVATQNPMGQVTEQAYDTLGRPITATQYLDTLPVRTVTRYDALGNRSSQTDALNHTTYFVYDDLNRVLSTISPEHVVITQTFDAVGRVLTTTNNLGETTSYHYDDLDRLVLTTNAEGNSTQYEYDAAGNRVVVINSEMVRNRYIYDDLNRLVTVIENDTGGSTTNDSNVFTYYRYDALGNQIATINGQGITTTFTLYDDLNRPTITIDALGNQTGATYDALGNTQVITDGNNEVTTFGYNGLNQTTQVSYLADNQVVQYAYDAVGNVVVMTDAVGVTTYTYDSLYRLTDVNDALDQAIAYEYDLAGNLLYLTYPDSRVVTYTYDADNRLISVVDWDENLTTYAYDQVGRLITTTLPNDVVSVNEYDRAGRLVTLTYTAADDTLVAQYQYQLDGLGYRQTVTETILSPDLFTAVEAFVANNGLLVLEAEKGQADDSGSSHGWASQTVQSGYAGTAYVRGVPDVGTRYDTDEVDNSPHRTFVISTTAATTYTVWVRGMATDASGDSIHLGVNGEVVDTTSDMTGFDRSWDWASLTMAGVSGTLPLAASDLYTLDLWLREDGVRVDRILLADDPEYVPTGMGPAESSQQVITQTTAGQLQTQVIQYTYDPLNRLTGATYTGAITASFSYAYDAVGNMLAYTETVGLETRQVTRYFNDANQLQASFDDVDGTTSFYYDGNGNLVRILPPGSDPAGGQRFGYDQRNLLITNTTYVTGTGDVPVVMYVYDGAGNRIQQIDYSGETPVTTSYTNHVLGLSQVIATHDGTTTTYNVFGLGLISQDDGEPALFLLTDGLGSVRTEMVSDEVTSVTGYDPYGNVIVYIGESGTVYGFTGEVTDGASSLVYLRARYYNPALHIFMSRDPYPGHRGRPQSQHGYSYTENNPVNYIDPTGQCLDCVVDVASMIYNFQVLVFDVKTGCGNAWNDIRALVLDGLSIVIPGLVGLGQTDNAVRFVRNIDDTDNIKILVVGDGNFEYSRSLYKTLSENGAAFELTGTTLVTPLSPQELAELKNSLPFRIEANIDATKLSSQIDMIGGQDFDVIIFNNPYIGVKDPVHPLKVDTEATGKATSQLIQTFKTEAYKVLRPGGEIHINVTQALLNKYKNVRAELKTAIQSSFRDSPYFAPFVPQQTNGHPFQGGYANNPALVKKLWNHVFRK